MVGKTIGLRHGSAAESSVEANAASMPGRRALTDDLAVAYEAREVGRVPASSPAQAKPRESVLPRLDLVSGEVSAGGSTHAAPPRRVADATAKAPNAVIKVIAYSKGKILGTPWGAKARWEGPLPQTYTGTRSATGWT